MKPKTPDNLTAAQLRTLRYVLKGMTNQEIAQKLDVTEATIKVHVSVLLKKFGVNNRVRLVLTALDQGYRA